MVSLRACEPTETRGLALAEAPLDSPADGHPRVASFAMQAIVGRRIRPRDVSVANERGAGTPYRSQDRPSQSAPELHS